MIPLDGPGQPLTHLCPGCAPDAVQPGDELWPAVVQLFAVPADGRRATAELHAVPRR
ncbi:hypothetical protein [Actinoplanes awajinensis]|uniref:hypothetical protein n=1 Tax=Actinoplanes awajinensis TaxID=135946 RepID=UPI000B2904D2|nr:hypothetical protein [Actinoplanes awajinensis]